MKLDKTAYQIGKIDGELNNYDNPYLPLDEESIDDDKYKYQSYEQGYAEAKEKNAEKMRKRNYLVDNIKL